MNPFLFILLLLKNITDLKNHVHNIGGPVQHASLDPQGRGSSLPPQSAHHLQRAPAKTILTTVPLQTVVLHVLLMRK